MNIGTVDVPQVSETPLVVSHFCLCVLQVGNFY